MAIDNKVRDEKIEYDINIEAAKIALSSSKIDKYEYLTGKEMLSSDQRRMIEQDKFNYSLLGKIFEKQTKTIKDQEEKQRKVIEELGKKQTDASQALELNGQGPRNKIVHDFAKERTKEIAKTEKTDYGNLLFVTTTGRLNDFNYYRKPSILFDDIRKGKTKVAEALNSQSTFKYELSDIKKDNKTRRNAFIRDNVNTLFKAQEKVLKLYKDYAELY